MTGFIARYAIPSQIRAGASAAIPSSQCCVELPLSDRTGGGLLRPDELARRAHPKGAARVHLVVVPEPAIELGHHRGRVGPGVEPDVVALEGLDGLRAAGVKHGTRPMAWANASVSWAVKQLPLSASHSTGCGVARVPKRRSTASSIRSRTAMPPIPRGLAVQARTSRSWVSIARRPVPRCHSSTGFERIRGPALVGGGRCDLTVVRSVSSASGVRCEQQAARFITR